MKNNITLKIFILCFSVLIIMLISIFGYSGNAYAFPFYDLKPQKLTLRAEFSTDYSKSSAERKHNILLAAKSLDKTFLDVNGEFSFNRAVGARTEKRGYKTAKIIVDGEFVEGMGGGVCQVSTTLYNAAIRAGLKITEFHAHSLSVSYVEPSMDAMVSFGSADLRFKNLTHNPVIIRTFADGNTLTVKVYGEPMKEKYEIKSVIKEEILPEYSEITDENGEYPDLYTGEKRIIKYGKKGIVSEGVLIKTINGKVVSSTRIRRDKYRAVNGIVVLGVMPAPDTASDNKIGFSYDGIDPAA